LGKAFSYLKDYVIQDSVTVTLQLTDGAYSSSVSVTVRHPNGNRIVIQGNTITNTVTSIQSSSGATGNWSYVLNMGSSVAGIIVGDYVILRGAANGTNPTRLLGVHKVTNVDTGNTRITVAVKHRHSQVASGAVTANATVVKIVYAFTGVSGIVIDQGCRLGALKKLVLEGTGVDTTVGVYALDGGVLIDSLDVGASNFAFGFCADRAGVLVLLSGVASGNTNYGFRSIRESFIDAGSSSSIASGNGSDGYASLENSVLVATDSRSTGNGANGYGAYYTGYLLALRCHADANTTHGFYANAGTIESGNNATNNKAFSNGQSGFFVTMAGVITCYGAESSNNGTWGFYAEKMATIYTASASGTGNTSGLHSPAQAAQGNNFGFNST
jgi:hypothetical protein